MKKLIILGAFSFLIATNTFTYQDVREFQTLIEDKENKTLIYIQKIPKIIPQNIKPTLKLLTNKVCSNPQLKEAIKKGFIFNYIYLTDKKSVYFRIDSCQ